MNTYKKYCPNVFVAQCEQEYKRGEIIIVETKRGKQNEHYVHNVVAQRDGFYFYSITRVDGYNIQEHAKKKIEKFKKWAAARYAKSDSFYEASKKDSDFLGLGEPIKVGHHSEKRHRKIIEQANNNIRKSIEESDKAAQHIERTLYWEDYADVINLSMPESLEFYKLQLEEAIADHKAYKDGTKDREHSYSLTYAKKKANDLKKKVDIAEKLWG